MPGAQVSTWWMVRSSHDCSSLLMSACGWHCCSEVAFDAQAIPHRHPCAKEVLVLSPDPTLECPPAAGVLSAIRAVNRGKGLLLLLGNYSGDVMNFEMAAEMAREERMEVVVRVAGGGSAAEAVGDGAAVAVAVPAAVPARGAWSLALLPPGTLARGLASATGRTGQTPRCVESSLVELIRRC